MTLTEAINRARRLARVTSTSHTDAEIVETINEAQQEFAKAAHGLLKEEYLTLSPKFDTRTNFALRITITGGADAMAATDVAITSTDRTDVSGTTVASDLQTAIQAAIGGGATTTVTWSTTTWTFTITTPAATTSVTIDEPSGITYVDARDLTGFSGTETGTTFESSIPTDCTVETDLPSDYLELVPPVEWDNNKLYPAPFDLFASPEVSGTPTWYGIRNEKIRLYPYPTSQKMFHIWYKYLPTSFTQGYQECGLTGKRSTTATGLAGATQYYFKVKVDGGATTEYDITTAAALDYDSVITLMNVEVDGLCEFALVDGDLRCTSDWVGQNSSIELSAGTTGTDLFATLTDFTAFDDAVDDSGGYDINLEDHWAMAVVYYTASALADEQFEDKVADRMWSRYRNMIQQYVVMKANTRPKLVTPPVPTPWYRVDETTL